MVKSVGGDWTRFLELPDLMEVDFHHEDAGNPWVRKTPYWQRMEEVWSNALGALKSAQDDGYKYVLFKHGSSTSRPGNTTTRSQIRGLIRSTESTPFVIKSRSKQHYSVFLAVIRPKD
tara:strand:+ start:377 stop:730 length:354 start_codon:yes stop_codon:yes gene_type:complete